MHCTYISTSLYEASAAEISQLLAFSRCGGHTDAAEEYIGKARRCGDGGVCNRQQKNGARYSYTRYTYRSDTGEFALKYFEIQV